MLTILIANVQYNFIETKDFEEKVDKKSPCGVCDLGKYKHYTLFWIQMAVSMWAMTRMLESQFDYVET